MEAGRTYSWAELGEHFEFEPAYLGSVGGMVSRPAQGALLLITYPGGAKSFDYGDYWNDGDLIYTGRGKSGDQKLTGPNLFVAENSRTLWVFEGGHGPRTLKFLGVAQCEDYWWSEGPDGAGVTRKVLRYRLVFGTAEGTRTAQLFTSDGGLGADYVPVDEHIAVTPPEPFSVDPDAVDRANAAHRRLQNEWV